MGWFFMSGLRQDDRKGTGLTEKSFWVKKEKAGFVLSILEVLVSCLKIKNWGLTPMFNTTTTHIH